jgi:serine/threonine protein phosphatase PrpC
MKRERVDGGGGVRCYVAQAASNAPCEDATFCERLSDGSVLAAVFDGHNGEQTGRFCVAHLRSIAERRLDKEKEAAETVLASAIRELDERWAAHVQSSDQRYLLGTQGACASLVLLRPGEKIFSSFVGDSRAMVGAVSDGVAMTVPLQRHEHSARDLEERERLEMLSFPKRRDSLFVRREKVAYVRGHIQTTRSIGDLYLREEKNRAEWSAMTGDAISWTRDDLSLISCVPESDSDELEDAEFVLICSDGVFDFVSEDLAVDFVHRILPTSSDPAAELLRFCMVKVESNFFF